MTDTNAPATPDPVFSTGKTVKLKSGGPLMSITQQMGYNESGKSHWVMCQWFDGPTPRKIELPESSLEVVEL